MRAIEEEGSGVVVALHAAAPGSLSRSIDIRSGKPAEAGDAVRGYGTGAQILAALGIHDMILLTNTHHSPVALSGYGLAIVEERPITAAELAMSTILLVEARFYPQLNDMLLAGARAAIEAAGHKHETLTVPGALELPGAIALAARSGRFCAFVAFGVVIRGETYHFEVVSERKRARADGPDAPGLRHRQRHPDGRERGAGDRPRRSARRATRAATRRTPRSHSTIFASNTRRNFVVLNLLRTHFREGRRTSPAWMLKRVQHDGSV